ncbi:MAG TPA: purine nucleoside permease [Roseiarcus sp.]
MVVRSRLIAVGLFAAGFAWPAVADEPPLAPKVLVITMFAGEAKPWLDGASFQRKIMVPGLAKAFPDVTCSDDGLCMTTTGMGYANAASSISAIVLSRKLDLTKTYFIIAGIAGVAPALGTLGSAHWARYAVDGGLQNEIDAREIPPGWSSGYLEIGAPAPGQKAEQDYGDQVYRLNEDLLQAAFRLTKDVELVDSDAAKAYRAKYAEPAATAPPQVSICDTISSDTWWFGDRLAEAMTASARLITDGQANPCTTQQEDNATLTALKRGADAGLLDFNRIAILRTAADFDREPPGEVAAESLTARTGGFLPSVVNAHRVAARLARAIVDDWATWSAGPPKQAVQ